MSFADTECIKKDEYNETFGRHDDMMMTPI